MSTDSPLSENSDQYQDDLNHFLNSEETVNELDSASRAKHRIGLIRRRQGVSLRTVARHWGCEVSEVRRQEAADSNLTLEQLYRWQELLNVPLDELLEDQDCQFAGPILRRSQLLKIMKTAVTIRENTHEKQTVRLITMMMEQLISVMPELADVGPWHGSGSRRSLDDFGRAASMQLSDDTFQE